MNGKSVLIKSILLATCLLLTVSFEVFHSKNSEGSIAVITFISLACVVFVVPLVRWKVILVSVFLFLAINLLM